MRESKCKVKGEKVWGGGERDEVKVKRKENV